jgi:amino acid transporter
LFEGTETVDDALRHPGARSLPSVNLPERIGYRAKKMALGPPVISARAHEEKLSKKSALGVLSSDCISSSAYGTEQMLISLLAVFGLTGFHILLPMTGVVLAVLILMTLSYREVVTVYTKAGGSYVVARENFGPRVAQLASVALLIDYIVTVAVQAAAGIAAITSLVPTLSHGQTPTMLAVLVVLVLAYGNLRGIREAGRAFAFPTYFFVASAGLVILIGVVREVFGDLPQYATTRAGLLPITNEHHAIFTFAAIYVLLKAFANGGSSLTGLEAISNGVSAFKRPEGVNARRTLVVMSVLLGFLVAGISFLAFETHAAPYANGSPTVISQVTRAVFGQTWYGNAGWAIVQVATALILIAGANTPFTGFPFLASFIAEDSFLPRQLTRRGHKLAFSNGIVVLTVVALALLLVVGANVDNLVPFYAIGVFTGFTMAGLGMAKYHRTRREQGWRHRLLINFTGGVVSALVVLIFAVVKFTEGAWLVVVLFPIMWLGLIRLNGNYRREARSLDLVTARAADPTTAGTLIPRADGLTNYARHVVVVLVDRVDLSVLRALRYAGTLRPSELRAVHIALDQQLADALTREWIDRGLCDRVPLQIVTCPDRRLVRAVSELALRTVIEHQAEVTVLLPRRTYRWFSQRLLHDRTADRIAAAASRIPHVAATIVPFDTTLSAEAESKLERVLATDQTDHSDRPSAVSPSGGEARAVETLSARAVRVHADGPLVPMLSSRGAGTTPIGSVQAHELVVVEGRIVSVQVGSVAGRSLEIRVFDETGGIQLLFFGRTRIAGMNVGQAIRARGRAGLYKNHLSLANPRYELLP